MEQFILLSLMSFFKNLPDNNPAYLDILKLLVGSTLWIGGLVGFMYRREMKLKTNLSK